MFNSRKVQQPVRVYHDETLRKFRLCPFPEGSTSNTATYGTFQFLCGNCDTRKYSSEVTLLIICEY